MSYQKHKQEVYKLHKLVVRHNKQPQRYNKVFKFKDVETNLYGIANKDLKIIEEPFIKEIVETESFPIKKVLPLRSSIGGKIDIYSETKNQKN